MQETPAAPATSASPDPAEATRDDVVLEVRGLTKRYDDGTVAVRDVSFELRRGEVLGVLGPNGAGKTTTIEILSGFRARSAGEVRLLGLDPGRRDHLRELRRRVGLVPQRSGQLRYLTVREVLESTRAFYPDPRDASEVLELVGLTDSADVLVRRLSGGQERRLDVGTALIGRPEVVFLDEPTTGFDPAARRAAWDVIADLARLGTSVVLTTHYMEEASELADRVLVLAGGRVVGEGTPRALADGLLLTTRIRARLPLGITPEDLPPSIAAGLVAPGEFELAVDQPTAAVAALCTWALDHGLSLADLDVRAPSLEDSYLELVARDGVGRE